MKLNVSAPLHNSGTTQEKWRRRCSVNFHFFDFRLNLKFSESEFHSHFREFLKNDCGSRNQMTYQAQISDRV